MILPLYLVCIFPKAPCTYLGARCAQFCKPLGPPRDPRGSPENILGTFQGPAEISWLPPKDTWGAPGTPPGTHWQPMVCQGPPGPSYGPLGGAQVPMELSQAVSLLFQGVRIDIADVHCMPVSSGAPSGIWSPRVPRIPPGEILGTSQGRPGDPLGTSQGPPGTWLGLLFLFDEVLHRRFHWISWNVQYFIRSH